MAKRKLCQALAVVLALGMCTTDRKSTRLNSSHD